MFFRCAIRGEEAMPEEHVSTLLYAPNQGTTPDFVPQDSGAQTGFVATCNLGFHGIIAGTFDFLGLEELIDRAIGKVGSHVKINYGAAIKAMVLQLLTASYQSLYKTSEYFKNIPLSALLGLPVTAEAMERSMLGRMLDDIGESSPKTLFMECAAQAAHKLELCIRQAHLDSTSFHFDTDVKKTDGPDALAELRIEHGYSRDHRPDLPQINMIGLVDGVSKLPVYTDAISGSVNDAKSFFKFLEKDWPILRQQFKELEYLVGDSAFCSQEILKQAAEHKIHIVTRAPDKLQITKECFEMASEQQLKPIYLNDLSGSYGMWCGIRQIGGVDVKLLLISNERMRASKTKTIERRAQKELDALKKELKKLRTQPAACRADAEKQLNELKARTRLCSIGKAEFIEETRQTRRGRPSRKNPEANQQKIVAVKVIAEANIDNQKVQEVVTKEIRFVIATTDTERPWTMAELCSVYRGQSSIERMWRISKDPTILINAVYLQKPSRIYALMWVLSIALLVFAVTEYRLRQTAKTLGITELSLFDRPPAKSRKSSSSRAKRQPSPGVPAKADSPQTEAPTQRSSAPQKEYNVLTLRRFRQYTQNSYISIQISDTTVRMTGKTDDFKALVRQMGAEWMRYYDINTYSYSAVQRLFKGKLDKSEQWCKIAFNVDTTMHNGEECAYA